MHDVETRDARDERHRAMALSRACEVECQDPGLARALRAVARDIGTEDERDGDLELLWEEPRIPEPEFGVLVRLPSIDRWDGVGMFRLDPRDDDRHLANPPECPGEDPDDLQF